MTAALQVGALRQGPCLDIDHDVFGDKFPCQKRIDHDGKHRNGDEELAVEWRKPIYGPEVPASVYLGGAPYGLTAYQIQMSNYGMWV